MVERRELPCHFEWFVEGGVDGSGEPDPVSDPGQRCKHGESVRSSHHVQVVNPAAVLPQPQAFGQEEEVEQAAFGRSREMYEGVEFDLAAGAGIGPHGGVVDPRKVRRQMYWLAAHWVNPHRRAINSCERSRSS